MPQGASGTCALTEASLPAAYGGGASGRGVTGACQPRAPKGPPANAVLTTAVDTWGRRWTPRCLSIPSGLLRRIVVDSCGRGHSPENRKAHPTEPPGMYTGRVTRRVTITFASGGRQRPSTDGT